MTKQTLEESTKNESLLYWNINLFNLCILCSRFYYFWVRGILNKNEAFLFNSISNAGAYVYALVFVGLATRSLARFSKYE